MTDSAARRMNSLKIQDSLKKEKVVKGKKDKEKPKEKKEEKKKTKKEKEKPQFTLAEIEQEKEKIREETKFLNGIVCSIDTPMMEGCRESLSQYRPKKEKITDDTAVGVLTILQGIYAVLFNAAFELQIQIEAHDPNVVKKLGVNSEAILRNSSISHFGIFLEEDITSLGRNDEGEDEMHIELIKKDRMGEKVKKKNERKEKWIRKEWIRCFSTALFPSCFYEFDYFEIQNKIRQQQLKSSLEAWEVSRLELLLVDPKTSLKEKVTDFESCLCEIAELTGTIPTGLVTKFLKGLKKKNGLLVKELYDTFCVIKSNFNKKQTAKQEKLAQFYFEFCCTLLAERLESTKKIFKIEVYRQWMDEITQTVIRSTGQKPHHDRDFQFRLFGQRIENPSAASSSSSSSSSLSPFRTCFK